MASCNYSSHVGGSVCGISSTNPANSVCVLLEECKKDIKSHLKNLNCHDALLKNEKDLLLARAGIFNRENSDQISICPRHRDMYGIRWRPSSRTNCNSPPSWAPHGMQKMKGDRGITYAQSQIIYNTTGMLVPVGSPICKQCRQNVSRADLLKPECSGDENLNVSAGPSPPELEVEEITQHSIVEEASQEVDELCERLGSLNITTDQSMYHAESSKSSNGSSDSTVSRRLKLNEFLLLGNKDPVKQPKKKWEASSVRTRNDRISKAKDVIVSSVTIIAPDNPGSLWIALKDSHCVERSLGLDTREDTKYLNALAETYDNAASWDTRRQILSIMADLVPSTVIQRYIPGVTEYRMKAARTHLACFGRGVPVEVKRSPRMRVDDLQLDHFLSFITSPHIILDLPFGQRYLQLSNGKVLETPNVIRSMVPQRIVAQYRQYCTEQSFEPFSESTMLRVLSSCSATVRKSLQGLDYITAEGAKAVDDLISIVEKIGDLGGRDRKWVQAHADALKRGKYYLKTDFKVHVTDESSVPDHCRVYSLSDPKDQQLSLDCNHRHEDKCSSCEELKATLTEIQESIENTQLTEEEHDNLIFQHRQAVQAIHAWKAHQLRTTQQDNAQSDVLDELDDSSVLITLDWAMKFLPQKYRETQADWFAKRGISWHISVVTRKIKDELSHQAFVHIVENCSQDTDDVLVLVEHLLLALKNDYPEIKDAFLRADNAGCYHSVAMVSACTIMASTGINIRRIDFSDPQGGKGPCDRKAATIKAHVRRYINEGNDVSTAKQFKEAMTSYGGVNGVRVALVDLKEEHKTSLEGKIEGVSGLNNYAYEDRGLVTWKAYRIGEGRIIPWSNLKDGCIRTFLRYSNMENHILYGKCLLREERYSLKDKAMMGYNQKLSEGTSRQPTLASHSSQTTQSSMNQLISRGWALRLHKKKGRFNENQRRYLDEKFQIGQQTGHKADPEQVSIDMRYAKKDDGSQRFIMDEYLFAQQIKSYFSRTASKLRKLDEADLQAMTEQEEYQNVRDGVILECQLVHPIMYDTHNICDLQSSGNLKKKFSVAMLHTVCEYFGIDVEHLKRTRFKAPYIELLSDLVKSCTCS
ncbi:hypothetical protein AC249_AIPGENE89 [Exaiptasia diaphana]|nr:hypothetical protein AC249_AIPGENE89 [Exaiptasia diaphana]